MMEVRSGGERQEEWRRGRPSLWAPPGGRHRTRTNNNPTDNMERGGGKIFSYLLPKLNIIFMKELFISLHSEV